jgi:hypothetical protein
MVCLKILYGTFLALTVVFAVAVGVPEVESEFTKVHNVISLELMAMNVSFL